ncbi:MAG: hypothetical protein HON98_04160 [Chloroflexi bacterium]|jgi:phosphoglycerate dehydrogenase-like enzyme|nr:hypothetical protein [Chloroflexota bacterium]MBT3671269.1 hypothetical protein [Chloroflexota bacterium]MBT4004339.1 hypothetical protein [Chloroflexota bacterium]MBT4304272.1 hypothetical protein [Chloroflexota bacterium]MBT4534291.1 hypothetical protein [Chloroflexota bacterium]
MAKTTEILITLPLNEQQLDSLHQLSENISISHIPTSDPEDISSEIWEKTEVLYSDSIFPESDQAPLLRWIQCLAEKKDCPPDNLILERDEIKVTTVEGLNAIQVAEHTVGLLLALSRKLPDLFNLQENNEWLNNRPKGYAPLDIFGSTVGIVGYNRIGRQIARLLKGFGCTILASKQNAMSPKNVGFVPKGTGDPDGEYFTRLYPHQAIRSMFKESNSVIITTAFSELTRNLVGEKQLEVLKPTAMLVDVSEGGVLNLEALTDHLADNRIAGAALDAFPTVPLPSDSLLWSLPNVIISPDIAGYSNNQSQRNFNLFAKNLSKYLDGQELFNQMSPRAGK